MIPWFIFFASGKGSLYDWRVYCTTCDWDVYGYDVSEPEYAYETTFDSFDLTVEHELC